MENLIIEGNIHDFCAPGATSREWIEEINEKVSLRIIEFTPNEKTDRPTIIFVAGWISLIRGWGDVLREMSRDFPIRYVETRDKISSQLKKGARMGVEDIGHDIVYLVQKWGLQENQYLLFGSSLGATAIMDAARFFKPKPRAMVLVAPNAGFRMPKAIQITVNAFWPPFYFFLRPILKWYLKNFRMQVEADRSQYDKYCQSLDAADPVKLKAAAKAIWHYEVWDKLPHIQMPVFIFSASTDKLHEPHNTARMLKLIPNARHLDMETNAATHSPPMVEAIRQFLDEKP